jgi:hypothetical protein
VVVPTMVIAVVVPTMVIAVVVPMMVIAMVVPAVVIVALREGRSSQQQRKPGRQHRTESTKSHL